MPEFMVVLRGADPERKVSPSGEIEGLMEKYYNWVDRLKKERRYIGGAPFRGGSKLLSGHRDWVVIADTPYAKAKEALTGYFIIAADSIPQAVEIAKSCPALTHGETVEVLELNN